MRREKIYPFIIFLVVGIIYAFPLLKDMGNWGEMDWDQYTFWHTVPREIILRYHQFPLWNPYSNGGNVLLAHSHCPFLSPLYIFVLIFGPIIGLKLEIIIHLFIGMLGMFFLSKHMNLSRCASFMPPIVYMLSSIYTLHLSEGHVEWLAMAFAPWLFLCFLKSLNRPGYIFGGIFFLALILLSGSVNVSNIIIMLLFNYSIFILLQERRIIPLKSLAAIFIGTFLLCAVKLIPMLEFLKENPRKINYNETTKFSLLPTILLSRDQGLLYQHTKWTSPQQKLEIRERKFEYSWHEYGAYIGFVPLILSIAGFFFYFKQHWPLLLTGMLSLWGSLGRGAFYDLWALLHKLPIYGSLRVPSRFILGFIFCISLFSGLGLSKLECIISGKRFAKFIISVIIGVIFFDLFLVNLPLLANTFNIKPLNIQRYSEFKQRYRGFNLFPKKSRSSMYPILLSNSGIINSYDVIGVKRGDVKTVADYDYKGETYFLNPDNEIEALTFSPNRIEVVANAQVEDLLVINQNFYQGWRAKVDKQTKQVKPFNGLISLNLPAGRHEVVFYYLPNSFIFGSIISLISILCFILVIGKVIYAHSTGISALQP